MHEVVAAETGLRTERRLSHVYVLDVPTYPRPLLITDAAINIAPTLEVKRDIVQNAIDLAHVMGVKQPRVAILAAVEVVNPEMRSTLDAAALCKMADRGQITGGIVDGPLAFDNAVSPKAARRQGHRFAGGRTGRHPGGAGPGGRQHAGQAACLPGRRRCGRRGCRRPRADHIDQPGGFGADADCVLRGGGADGAGQAGGTGARSGGDIRREPRQHRRRRTKA